MAQADFPPTPKNRRDIFELDDNLRLDYIIFVSLQWKKIGFGKVRFIIRHRTDQRF